MEFELCSLISLSRCKLLCYPHIHIQNKKTEIYATLLHYKPHLFFLLSFETVLECIKNAKGNAEKYFMIQT